MSEADNPTAGPANASAEFVRLEQELAQETSVFALMKEQMTSMLGMVTMFVVTIVLAVSVPVILMILCHWSLSPPDP